MALRREGLRARAVRGRSRFAANLLKTTALSTLALALSGAAAYSDDTGLWQPQVRAIIGADNNGGNAALEGFIPIKQTAESVLFLDVRAKHDFKDASGQDIGLGIRRIVNPDLMVGGYAYINLENYNGTQFTSATLGAEAITPNFDAHVNVFVPIKGDSTDHSASSTLSMVSNQLIEQISVLDHRNYAAWGIEGEIGAQVPVNLPDKHSLRLDIGGYHFEDPHGDDGSITGAKAGLEYTIGDVFGSGTSLVFAGEVRNDNRDDTQFAGSVRLNIPFNSGHGSGDGADSGPEPVYPVSEGLRKRLNERVRGDIGVRIQSQDKTGGSTTRVAINAATNAAFGKFYFADGGLAGAGTLGDPTTLDDAVTKAGSGGFVVALGGNGNLTTAGVTLANGQTVIGGGESVTARLFNGGTTTFNLGGSDGTIQGTNVANNVITLGNGNTLNGITITGGADGIFGNNITGAKLTNVTVTNAGGNGADFKGTSTGITGSNFTASGNGLDGLHIEGNGTYNFTGTTLLQGNGDDGLDITGQGTYTFATINALNNTDRGITVQGTSSGGTFTTTGGTIAGNGGIGVYIDPITAHVVLDSIIQTGGQAGVVLDHVSGSFTVTGNTTISNTTGPAIAISDSPATIRFGDINVTNPGAGGMSFTGVNAAVVAGNIVISGLGVGTGLDFSGSQTNFTARSLNITGAGGSIGIDLADTTGDATITITDGGTISGVDTGVRFGIAGSLTHSANAEFSFGGGSISGSTASLDARGLNQTLGHYGFGSTIFSGPQLFDQQNVIFVGAIGSSGDGSSTSSLLAIDQADLDTQSNAIFVLVNEGSPIATTGGFSLSTGQTLASFGNGRGFSLGGIPVNVTGDNIQHDTMISDPGGGAATLTNSGAGAVVTAAAGGSLLDFNISSGSGAAISASGSGSLTVQGVTVSGVATGLALDNFSGTGSFNNFDVTSAGTGVSITGGTTGTLTFDAASSIAGTTGVAFNIDSSTPNLTYNGTINQTAAASAVKINAMTGGSTTFGGKITASTGAANAIDLSGDTGGAINFTGGLDLTTDGGFGFSAVNGGTLTVTGSGNTINTGAGATEKGLQLLGGASGLTIGAAGVTFASVTVDGSGGAVPTGIVIDNTSGGNVTFGAVSISRANGDAIRLSNIASGTYTFNGTTTLATVGGSGPGFTVQNSGATVSVNNLVTSGVNGADVSLNGNTGTIGIGGTITNSGTGDGVVVSGSSAAITIGATITSSATALGTAVKVDGITGGSVAFTGAITSTGTGNLFAIGSNGAPTGGTISFSGSALTATGGGGAVVSGLGAGATLSVTAPLSVTNATGNGLSISNVAGSATFGAVTVSGAGGNGIDIGGSAGSVTFTGTTSVTMGSAASTAGINFSGTNADVTFGTTNVTLGAGANQTGIDFSGSSTTAGFGLTTITGTGDLTSRGIDLSSTSGNKTITFLRGSSITNAGVGVELSSGGTTATSANANFTFGDGNAGDGRQSSITAAAGGYTVNTIGLDPSLGNYDFDDVTFTGPAHLVSAVGGVIMVSQSGGVIAAGTDGLSGAVTTVTVAQADAMTGNLTFAFVGTVDLSATPFTLDSGQSITGFGNGTSILTSGTVQPINVQGNLGATGGSVTGNEGVVTGSGDFMHLLGGNQVRNTAFDFTGATGSVFTIDQNAIGFDNTGGVIIEGVTVSNVAAGQTAFKVVDVDTNLSIINNNINVAGTLLEANGGAGDITVTRGTLPNSATAGTLTGGGVNIANRTGGLVNFADKATIGGNGISLTGNTGSTVTFADLDVSTNGATAFTATGGGTINVTTGTLTNANGQAMALDGIAAGINFASTSATFTSGNGIDLRNLAGTANFGTGTLTNTGTGTSFNVGSATNASGGNAVISYAGTIATNGLGAAVSVQELTGGSVTLSGNLTDNNAAGGGNILIGGIDNGMAATVTFSGATKQISSGATDGVSLGLAGNYPAGAPAPNTNGTINFANGGLDITTAAGAGFVAGYGGTVSVSGSGNRITSGANGLIIASADVGSAGVTFNSISAVSNSDGAGVLLSGANLAGDVNIGGLRDTGYIGGSLANLSGAGAVNFTGTIDLDVSETGFDIGGQLGTINIANVAGSTLTIDGGKWGVALNTQGGTIHVGGNGGSASIGATTSTLNSALALSGGNNLAFGTLDYNGSIKVGTGAAVATGAGDWTHLTLTGSVSSTTSSNAFDFWTADGSYTISSTIDHHGSGQGVYVNGFSDGAITFDGTSKVFDTSSGGNNAVTKDPSGDTVNHQGVGTLDFTNGGLKITTASGTGFSASTFEGGTVSVIGSGNTITTGTGTALNLDGATVGAGGFNFASVTTDGAATGVSLNNVSGGGISLGAVDLKDITSRGVDISGTLGSALGFDSLKIGLNTTNAVGLDLNGASLGTSTITAGDFDVGGGGFAGTIGIDMAGTTGTGTIQLGDLVNNNPTGQTSTISNVGYGVQLSSATNARLVFGDGQGPAESSIATTGGQVIHATDSLPTAGDYNFNDVNFSGDTANLSSISVYYVVEGGTGDGSLANPGSYTSAQASTANVIVLIDKTTGGSQSTIDMAGSTFQLDDGQVLLAFKSGDAAVDVSQLGVDAGGGASAAFHFTTVQNTPVIAAPIGIDSLRPILQSNSATSVINLATTGSGAFTGGIENLIIRNTGAGAGVAVDATSASSFFLRNNDIAAGGRALDFSTTSAPASTLLLSLDGNTLQSTGSALAASFVGQNINATQNSIAIRSFAGNTVGGGTGGGIAFSGVTFDSTGSGGTVSVGTLDIGTLAARVSGDGISLVNTSGTLDLGTFTVFNDGGTGLLVDAKGPPATTFSLNSSGGSVDTTNGAAFNLDPLTVNMTVDSVSASGGANGIIFDGVAGTFTVTGATTITGTTGDGISAINTNTGTFNFNTVTVNNTTGGGIGWATGTLNVTGLANIDTTSGAGFTQSGGTTGFDGGLTIDTTTGTGIVGTGGMMTVAATGGSETVNSISGQAISLANMTAAIALDSTSSGGGANNVGLTNLGGTLGLGSGALSGATGASFLVSGGTANVTYSGNITQASNAAMVSVSGGHTGTLTFSTGTLSATNGTGLQFSNADGTYNFNGTTTLNGGDAGVDITTGSNGTFSFGANTSITNPSGVGFNVDGGAGNITYAGTIAKNNANNIVSVQNRTGGTASFGGTIAASGTSGGIALATNTGAIINFTNTLTLNTSGSGAAGFSATGGGTISATGSGNTISTGTGTALSLNGVTVGAGGVNFSSVSANGAATGISLTNVASSGAGAVALGTVTLQGITGTGVSVSGTLGPPLSFNSLAIGLNSSTATAFSLNGATINAAITAADFDVTNAAAAGTSIGVDLRGATGGQTMRLGDAAAGGVSSSIAGVNTGIFLNSTTNLAFTFGDGESGTDQGSTISANVGIDASSAPASGTYNFKDVNFQASPGLGFGIGKIYFVGASATGDGSGKDQNNLATLSTAEAAAVSTDIIVLVNNGVITAASSNGNNTLVLQANEQVRGFGNGNINLALNVPLPVQLASNSLSIADQTSGGAATLTSADGSSVITLGSSGNIIDGFTINGDDGTGVNAAIGISGNGTANATISNMTIRNVTGADIDFGTGATGTTTLANLFLVSTGAPGTAIKFGAASGTVTATNVDTTGGGGLSVVGGDAAFSFDSTSSVASVAGTAVSITNRSGGSFGFAGTVTSSIGASGIVISGATGANTVSFTGAVSHNNATGAAVSINNGGQTSTVSFANLTITTGGSNTAFTATNGGTVNVATGSVSTTASQAINLNGIATTTGINFTSTTSGGGVNNVVVSGVTGAGVVSLGTGSLTGATGVAFLGSGGTTSITYGGSITKSSNGRTIDIQNRTGGSVTFNGAITSTGASDGIFLNSNTGSTINFANTLTIDTSSSGTNGFSATGGGTISATGTGSSINSGTATALNVANTTIGAGNLTFQSISSNGAVNGIVLNTTGSSGGLTVTGTGAANSGGTIQNTSGDGISLTNTAKVSLTNIHVTNTSGNGIGGTTVNGFSLANSTIDGANGGSAINQGSIYFTDLTGTAAITNSVVKGGHQDNISILTSSGTLALTISGSTIRDTDTGTNGNDNLFIEANGTATVTAHVTGNTFAATNGDHLQTVGDNSATMTIVATGNTFSGGGGVNALGQGITISGGSAGSTEHVNFNISNNTMTGTIQGGAINVNEGAGSGIWQGQVAGNTIGTVGNATSGTTQSSGIRAENHSTGGIMTVIIDSNHVSGWGGGPAINLQDGEPDNGTAVLNATVSNNIIDTPGAGSQHGIVFNIGAAAVSTNSVAFLNIFGNTVDLGATPPNSGSTIRIRQRNDSTVHLQGYAGAAGDTAAVISYLSGLNPGLTPASDITTTSQFTTSGHGFLSGTTPLPTVPN
ncbi:right-handed parallel beta-helix repeat-containing protein [Mesorhizobium sp. B2-4-15]|uniref:right-handed parallel beta-helix repeat-containing protein n=1 Tax=Mesorhizobium sp. B2-4-15 TaxID=2589934 RepID=UPI0015EF0D48|nr:right-handed parallel beta-helix repeat-containing protein [Mesorhizobium sp. B2-4-15]